MPVFPIRDTPTETMISDISQGSAATHLRCGGIFSDNVITIFFLIVTVKEF